VLEPLSRRPGAPARVSTNLAVARAALGDVQARRELLGEGASDAELDALLRELGARGAPGQE
jgi:hypothetical protein